MRPSRSPRISSGRNPSCSCGGERGSPGSASGSSGDDYAPSPRHHQGEQHGDDALAGGGNPVGQDRGRCCGESEPEHHESNSDRTILIHGRPNYSACHSSFMAGVTPQPATSCECLQTGPRSRQRCRASLRRRPPPRLHMRGEAGEQGGIAANWAATHWFRSASPRPQRRPQRPAPAPRSPLRPRRSPRSTERHLPS